MNPSSHWMVAKTGLMLTELIAERAANFLVEDGQIGVEIGFDQAQGATAVFVMNGFELVGSARDLGGNDRVLTFATTAFRRIL